MDRRQARALDVWRVDLRRPSAWLEQARATVLTPEEGEPRGREAEAPFRRRLVARAALRIALGRRLAREPRELRLVRGANGKPALAQEDGATVHFNLSHSGDLGVIAISAEAAVGVDVETVRDRAHLERLTRARFAPAEADAILALEGEERRRAFYSVWTRKEAYLKAIGLGLGAQLDSFAVAASGRPEVVAPLDGDAGPWTLADLELGDGIQGAVAVASALPAPDSISPRPLPMLSG